MLALWPRGGELPFGNVTSLVLSREISEPRLSWDGRPCSGLELAKFRLQEFSAFEVSFFVPIDQCSAVLLSSYLLRCNEALVRSLSLSLVLISQVTSKEMVFFVISQNIMFLIYF